MSKELTFYCILCGREFRSRDAETVICPACGGPPEAPAPDQPVGTELVSAPQATDGTPSSRPQGTVVMDESAVSARARAAAGDAPLEWKEGDVILDLYEVKGTLGSGAMGIVYRVHHKKWNIDLAVKAPLLAALEKAGGLDAFVGEAAAWVKLGLHPHIVTCYYVRVLGGVPRIFTECVEGGSLKDWIRDRRLYAGGEREALRRILDLAIQFAWGLGYAHEQGLVHQDVKPANALLTPDGTLKVTDFGLVKSKGYTPAYAAPEQILRGKVDARTDIWGWGVSVLEMFTGEVTWAEGSSAAAVLENSLSEPPADLPRMPPGVAELLRACFQNDPHLRPPNMDAVAERLIAIYQQETGEPYPRAKPNPLELRADSLNNYAVSLLDLGREEEAVRYWQEALEVDPAHPEAAYNLSLWQWRRGEIDDRAAVARMVEVYQAHPGDWRCAWLLANLHYERGDMEQAAALLEPYGGREEVKELYARARGSLGMRCLRILEGHTNGVRSVAFSPDGQYALSGSWEYTLRLWKIATGEYLRTFEGHTWIVLSVAFSPDGRYALSGSGDKTLRLWALEWELEEKEPADWDEGARPYLDIFLTLHTPYGPDGFTRVGTPQWTEEDFQKLLTELGYRGYGWLKPEGVRRELERMARERG
jgi:serine/threonine protein kinase